MAHGAPENVIAEARQHIEENEPSIYVENAPLLDLWLSVCRYWRRSEMTGAFLHLDLGQVKIIMESRTQWPDDEALRMLQRMEAAALPILNEHIKKHA